MLLLLGGARRDFEATFRVVGFSQATSLVFLLPFCGQFIGSCGASCSACSASPRRTGSVTASGGGGAPALVLVCCCCAGSSSSSRGDRRRPGPGVVKPRPGGGGAPAPAAGDGARSALGAIFGGIGLVAAGAVACCGWTASPHALRLQGPDRPALPDCGSTADEPLFAFDFAGAFAMNPFTTLLAFAIAAWRWRPRPAATPRGGGLEVREPLAFGLRAAALLLFLANWCTCSSPAVDARPRLYSDSHGRIAPGLVVVPLFNEVENLEDLHRQLTAALGHRRSFELVLVDDGSTDGTQEKLLALEAADPRVRPVILRRNFGQTAPLRRIRPLPGRSW